MELSTDNLTKEGEADGAVSKTEVQNKVREDPDGVD